jgi:formate hydrogenlyase subunit 4
LRGQLRIGEATAGLAGALLFASLFISWYDGQSAWEAFGVIDVLLAAAGLAGVVLALLSATHSKTDVPIAGAALTVLAGVIAILLVVYGLLDPIDDLSREVGLFLGLVGALGLAVGACVAIRVES